MGDRQFACFEDHDLFAGIDCAGSDKIDLWPHFAGVCCVHWASPSTAPLNYFHFKESEFCQTNRDFSLGRGTDTHNTSIHVIEGERKVQEIERYIAKLRPHPKSS